LQVSLDAFTVSLDSLADESIGTIGDGKDSIRRFGDGEQAVSGGDDDVQHVLNRNTTELLALPMVSIGMHNVAFNSCVACTGAVPCLNQNATYSIGEGGRLHHHATSIIYTR
jgi:hypothetical protein